MLVFSIILQMLIVVTSSLAILMVGCNGHREKLTGSIIGIFAQLLWIIATCMAKQWGMLILSISYLVFYINILIRNKPISKLEKYEYTESKN